MKQLSQAILSLLAQVVLSEVVLGTALGVAATSMFSETLDDLLARVRGDSAAWTETIEHEPSQGLVVFALRHESVEGDWLHITCTLPNQDLRVTVELQRPIIIDAPFTGYLNVGHRTGRGQTEHHWWAFDEKESIVTAPVELYLAQRITWADEFYFTGQFEDRGERYEATFKMSYREPDHPAKRILTACGAPLTRPQVSAPVATPEPAVSPSPAA